MYKKLMLTCLFISLSGCGSSVEKWGCENNTVNVVLDLDNKILRVERPNGDFVNASKIEVSGDLVLVQEEGYRTGDSVFNRKTGVWKEYNDQMNCEKI